MKVRSYCDDRHFNSIQYFTEDLGRAICKDCAHKYATEGHVLRPIKDVASLDLYDLKITSTKGKTLLEEIMKFIHRAKMKYDEMKESVIVAFEKYISQLTQLKEKTIAEIEKDGPGTFSTNFHELNNLYANLRNVIETSDQLANELDALIQGSQHQLTIKKLQEVDIKSNNEQVDKIRKLFETNALISQGIEPFKVTNVDYSSPTLYSHVGLSRVLNGPGATSPLPKQSSINPSFTSSSIAPNPYSSLVGTNATLPLSNPKSGLNFYNGPSNASPLNNSIISSNLYSQSLLTIVHSFYNGKLIIYDLATQQISTVETPLMEEFPQNCFPSIFIKDGIFISGGYKNNNAINHCFIFDLIKSQMLRPSDMIRKRYYHSMILVGRRWIYSIGGHDNTNSLRECEKYDIDLDKWEQVHGLTNDRSCTTTTCFQERLLYTFGGWCDSNKSYMNSIEKLDTLNEVSGWMIITINDSSYIPRYGCNSCQISINLSIIFGGVNSKNEFSDCYLFDAQNESLTLKSKMRVANYFYNQCSQQAFYKGIAYAVDNNMSLQYYDTRTNDWGILKWNQWNPTGKS